MACDELLPRDWRTKAQALGCWRRLTGEPVDLHYLHRATVHYGVRCWAPPGEYYGGQYYDWFSEPVDGWIELEDCCYLEDSEPPGDALILPEFSGRLAGRFRRTAHQVHLIAAGEGEPWWSRVIGPATIVVL